MQTLQALAAVLENCEPTKETHHDRKRRARVDAVEAERLAEYGTICAFEAHFIRDEDARHGDWQAARESDRWA